MSDLFIYTDPRDHESPLWMLHLPSMTLASLKLASARSGEPHTLLNYQDGEPSAEALKAFTDYLEGISPGAGTGSRMVTRSGSHADLPGILLLSPALAHGFLIYDSIRDLALGWTQVGGVIPAKWGGPVPSSEVERRTAVTRLLESVDPADPVGKAIVDLASGLGYPAALWLDSGNPLPRSRPSSLSQPS